MTDTQTLIGLLDGQSQPVCARLTPNKIVDADFERGYVKLEFSEQPAFSNHFGYSDCEHRPARIKSHTGPRAFCRTAPRELVGVR